jgi:hypothetical protein
MRNRLENKAFRGIVNGGSNPTAATHKPLGNQGFCVSIAFRRFRFFWVLRCQKGAERPPRYLTATRLTARSRSTATISETAV